MTDGQMAQEQATESAGLKNKGRVVSAVIFKKPSVSFWATIANNISFYMDTIQSLVFDEKNRITAISNALRCSNAVRRMIEEYQDEAGTVLRELLSEFIMEADLIDKILNQVQQNNYLISEEDSLFLYSRVFKINFFLFSLNKNFKRFTVQTP